MFEKPSLQGIFVRLPLHGPTQMFKNNIYR